MKPVLLFMLCTVGVLAEERMQIVQVAKAITTGVDDSSPVKIPELDFYSRLWTESLITTRALPPPEAPKGPNFADNLTLTGTYEMKGKVVAVLIDRTTQNVIEAFIGEDNADGIKIVKVEGSSAADITKVQVQKGTEIGWVSLPDPSSPEGGAPPPAPAPNAPIAGKPLMPQPGMVPPIPQPVPQPVIPQPAPPVLPPSDDPPLPPP
jgi:hypothetical protein